MTSFLKTNNDITFDIKFYDLEPDKKWAASLVLDEYGNPAIGNGVTVWEALSNCIEDIEPTLKILGIFEKVSEDLLAGKGKCSTCGNALPKLSEENPLVSL